MSTHPLPSLAARPPWRVTAEDPLHPDALRLRASLDQALQQITGDTGQSSFAVDDLTQAGAVWLMCRDRDGQALGCAALRPLPLPPDWPGHGQVGGMRPAAEIKRMHALPGTRGVGAALMRALIEAAQGQGLGWLLLSTRRVNTAAVAFYARHGFEEVPAYGRYVGRALSVCMARRFP
jgi:GNAT superfamily N-acetyltransferase